MSSKQAPLIDDDGEPLKADDAREGRASIGSSALVISLCVMTSRVTGFLRTWAMAFALGSTFLASSYQVANNLPNMLYELAVGGMIVTAFLPVYVSVKRRNGEEAGNAYASNLLSLTVVFLGIVAVICTVFSSQLIYTQSFMSSQDDMTTAVFFFRFFAVQILFYGASAIISGLLNASRGYLWSSLAPTFNNIIVIATFAAYALIAPQNPELALYIIAIGNPLGVLVQVAIQLPALRRNGIKMRFRIDLHDPALRETLSIGIPAIIVMATSFAVVSVQNAVAYRIVENGPSIIAYARLWFTLPYAFMAVPITTAMFTELSEMQAAGKTESLKQAIIDGTSQILFLITPFALYLIAFASPLVTLYHAGAFTEDNVHAVAFYLAVLAVSLPFYSVSTYLQKIFSSLREMRGFAFINLVCSLVQIGFTVGLGGLLFVDSPYALGVVALGETLFFLASDIVCFAFLKRRFGSFGLRGVARTFLESLALGALGAGIGYLIITFPLAGAFGAIQGSIGMSIIALVAGGLPALAVTFGLAVKFDLAGARWMKDALRGFRRRLLHR